MSDYVTFTTDNSFEIGNPDVHEIVDEDVHINHVANIEYGEVNYNEKKNDNKYLESYIHYKNDFIGDTIEEEPVLTESNARYTILPIDENYRDIWDLYKKHVSAFWVPEEIDLVKDDVDWVNSMNDGERLFLKYVLAFFAGSDGIVNMNLRERFQNEIKIKEIETFYTFQGMMENIHGETYSILLEKLISDPVECDKMINAIKTIDCIKKKAVWCEKWINSDKPFAHRLMAFAIVEGVFFSGSFAAIFWLKKRGILPGVMLSNKLISRDEGLHVMFACLLYNKLKNKLKNDVIYDILKEAVEIEKEFINKAIPCSMIGMNSNLMSQYIEYTADRLLGMIKCKSLFGSKNPFDFMELIDIDGKENFFEKRAGDYRNANVGNERKEFEILEDGF